MLVGKIDNIPSKEMDDQEQQHQYDNATSCWICNKEFSEDNGKKNYKVRDHCHFMEKFRGAAHNLCNLKYKNQNLCPYCFIILVGMMRIFFFFFFL